MRRIVLVVPGLFDSLGESVLRSLPTQFARLVSRSQVLRIAEPPKVESPEAFVLGMPPGAGQLRQGPLTISALGADPPDRSTHFHVSVGALVEGQVIVPSSGPTPDELKVIVEAGKRLNTKLLTFVAGSGLDHGLVWEKEGDLATTPPPTSYAESRPEGDGESLLRRFIEDSINLLSEQEFNIRRIDAGVAPLNILWPWGHGVRRPVPNLALRRGGPAMVLSN